MSIEIVPDWMINLEDEDINFIKKFILNSGSLKEMAKEYGVTYPTVRLKLDKVIQKINTEDMIKENSYIALIKRYAIDEKIELEVAKVLISQYRKNMDRVDT